MMSSAVAFTGCDEELALPPMIEPQATIEANTTIADIKAAVWKSDRNYVTEIGQSAGADIIRAGRVVSSDKTGNVYKSVILQDETGALTVAINAYDLYETYQQGQEIVVNLTGLKIGGYNGLMQLGGEGEYNGSPSMTFMEAELFAAHAQQNGLARPELIDTLVTTIPELNTAKGTDAGLQKWQSQLIRLDDVTFEDAGKVFAGSSTTNRYIKDAQGNRINVRNSSYASFTNYILPSGSGSVVGILSYYGTDWQILLNDVDGLIGYGEIDHGTGGNQPGGGDDQPGGGDDQPGNSDPGEVTGNGSADAPFSVAAVIKGSTGTDVWVEGYIVGSVSGASLSGASFSATSTQASNLLIAASADENNIDNCIPVQLVAGTAPRTALNLVDNPGVYKMRVVLKGNIEKYFGVNGLKSVSEYVLDGEVPSTPPSADANIFKAVTTITSGKSYVMVAESKVAKPLTSNYGYLYVDDVTVGADNTVSVSDANAFVITAVNGGYTIAQSDGRYLYQTGTYNSFNVDASAVEGSTWTIKANSDGTMVITNVSVNKSIQYDTQYGSFGSYPDVRGVYPKLYEKVD